MSASASSPTFFPLILKEVVSQVILGRGEEESVVLDRAVRLPLDL